MNWTQLALVALGGALGAASRYGASQVIPSPIALISINLTGCFLLGIASVTLPNSWLLLLGTGFLGAFTTMSAFGVESLTLLQKSALRGIGYVAIHAIGAPLLAWLGIKTAS